MTLWSDDEDAPSCGVCRGSGKITSWAGGNEGWERRRCHACHGTGLEGDVSEFLTPHGAARTSCDCRDCAAEVRYDDAVQWIVVEGDWSVDDAEALAGFTAVQLVASLWSMDAIEVAKAVLHRRRKIRGIWPF